MTETTKLPSIGNLDESDESKRLYIVSLLDMIVQDQGDYYWNRYETVNNKAESCDEWLDGPQGSAHVAIMDALTEFRDEIDSMDFSDEDYKSFNQTTHVPDDSQDETP